MKNAGMLSFEDGIGREGIRFPARLYAPESPAPVRRPCLVAFDRHRHRAVSLQCALRRQLLELEAAVPSGLEVCGVGPGVDNAGLFSCCPFGTAVGCAEFYFAIPWAGASRKAPRGGTRPTWFCHPLHGAIPNGQGGDGSDTLKIFPINLLVGQRMSKWLW
jgi:hypothetical protein